MIAMRAPLPPHRSTNRSRISRVVQFLFGAADRDNVATRRVVRVVRGTHKLNLFELPEDLLFAVANVAHAANKHVTDFVRVIQDHQVRGAILCKPATIVQSQQACDVAGQCRQSAIKWHASVQQIGKRIGQHRGTTDVHFRDLALVVKDRQAAATIRADGNFVSRRTAIEITRKSHIGGPGIVSIGDRECRDIHRYCHPPRAAEPRRKALSGD